MLNSTKSKLITNIMDNFNLVNLIDKPTCFKNLDKPTLIDVILTNSSSLLCNSSVISSSISDCHSMVFTSLKEQVNTVSKKKIQFRSYKNFDENAFNTELDKVPFQVAFTFKDVDDTYWAYNKLFYEILDEHAPIKQKYLKKSSPPYMNSKYRKIIYQTRQAHNTYLKYKSKNNWEKYRKLRNLKTKVKRESITTYFMKRCCGGPKSWSKG